MRAILEYNLSNSEIIEYIEKYTKDERKRSFLKNRIVKCEPYENLCYPEWEGLYFKKMKRIERDFEKWLTKAIMLEIGGLK